MPFPTKREADGNADEGTKRDNSLLMIGKVWQMTINRCIEADNIPRHHIFITKRTVIVSPKGRSRHAVNFLW